MTVAVFWAAPAPTSDDVTVYVTGVQVRVAPGARLPPVHVTVPTFGSETWTPLSVTLPVFWTRNV